MHGSEITAMCKKCNKQVPATTFILDPVYKMMVCPACVKARKDAEISASKKSTQVKPTDVHQNAHHEGDELLITPHEKESQSPKHKDWDEQDDYLKKVYDERLQNKPEFEQLDAERIKYVCAKCKYKFVYNTVRKHPSTCPYCGMQILMFTQTKYPV